MKLSELIKAIPVRRITGTGGELPEVTSIHYRAQEVKPGGVFVAIPGTVSDGHAFIDTAVSRGAAAVISQHPVRSRVPVAVVDDSRKALSAAAAAFYGHPSRKLCVVGITGTNGKTTTTYLIESILKAAGHSVGVIGTVNYRFLGKTFPNPVTTPESSDLQKILSDMAAGGVTHVVLEVSSHAIELHRVADCRMDVGVFTNLTQDHLDFHGSMDRYWESKRRLFTVYLPQKKEASAVVNTDDARGKILASELKIPVFRYGKDVDNEIRETGSRQDLDGISATVETPSGSFAARSPLVGAHNIQNILAATGAGVALGVELPAIGRGIENVAAVPGRLERLADSLGRFVFVDYAHTPDALENVLTALHAVSRGSIICIFGCGGDRDKAKRPKMGEIVGELADLAIITSDNPRTEAPLDIIEQTRIGVVRSSPIAFDPAQLKAGFQGKGHLIEPDREKAIRLGIFASSPGDSVLIAGKGHETYQVIGKQAFPFDDRIQAAKALEELRNVQCRMPDVQGPRKGD